MTKGRKIKALSLKAENLLWANDKKIRPSMDMADNFLLSNHQHEIRKNKI